MTRRERIHRTAQTLLLVAVLYLAHYPARPAASGPLGLSAEFWHMIVISAIVAMVVAAAYLLVRVVEREEAGE